MLYSKIVLYNNIMKKIATAVVLLTLAATMNGETYNIERFNQYGPYRVTSPLMIDSVDVKGKAWTGPKEGVVPSVISLPGKGRKVESPYTPSCDGPGVEILSFDFENTSYAKALAEIEGVADYSLYLDGRKVAGNELSLRPQTHNIVLRYMVTPDIGKKPITVSLRSEGNAGFRERADGKRRYTLEDVVHGKRITGVSMSPDGKYFITNYSTTIRGGESNYHTVVRDSRTHRVVSRPAENVEWMPKGSRYSYSRAATDGRQIVAVDAATGEETVIVAGLPEAVSYIFTPDEQSLILITKESGVKEDPGVYRILEPEDRQPGWRDRYGLAICDIATGVVSPLTFGHRNVQLQDISDDSRHLLFLTSESRLNKRPTTLFSLYSLDLESMKADTILNKDGFILSAKYSPDGEQVVVAGSPEAIGGIGKNVPEGRIPSMSDIQLYIINIADGEKRAMTREFNPSVGYFEWNRNDGGIYFTADDRDRVNLFRLDAKSGKIKQLPMEQEIVAGFSLADGSNRMVWFGESASAPQSLYLRDAGGTRSELVETPRGEQLSNVNLGKCEAWDFVNSRGDTICGRFYLPSDFDPEKKYPLIVNYYGGCSPIERTFEGRYPLNLYAEQGYVVYVLEPSGATGFGQEFSSRHVNTAGKGVAEDIIEGTKKFCEEHPFVDKDKIGCIGASYGGFMTQYLQTLTDIFAAAISHAGISDHTSYWGEGYWGYSYSEESMAESYPWKDPDLYVKQSPLFNADKIHTPLLFLHGDKDNNVPVGESIQMFTALKLLDRPTAFVAVADQDHHIKDYGKRIKWQDTIFAWFAKYLKGDSSWWDAMYEPTPL